MNHYLNFEDATVEDIFSFIYATDEVHFDPSAEGDCYILREEGTREDPTNQVEKPGLEGNKLHCASWVTANDKISELIFYHDEDEERTEQPKHRLKPRRKKAWTEEQYQDEVMLCMHNIQPWPPPDYDSHLHGCLTLPYGQQADTCLPEHSVVYIVTPFSLR